MNCKKGLMYGVLVWAAMFIVVSILLAYKMEQNMIFTVIVTVFTLIVAYFLARRLAPVSYGLALQYGLVFAVVGIVLDFLISKQFAPDIFTTTSYWVSYILIVLVPMLAVKKNPVMV